MGSYKKSTGGNYAATQLQQPVSAVTRRIMGTPSQLRSPVAKRPASAPVAMQGWLHKQGSEGLMLWKKRWFVLSEYCLFYYKNPEEDRLLGSILLPSYKISPCSAIEGKIFRKKYSFKAEHANMRTYYFAADSKDQMVQWMNSMSLATIAQQSNGLSQQNTLVKSDKVSFHFANNYPNHSDHDQLKNGSAGGSWPLPARLNERNSSCSSGGGGGGGGTVDSSSNSSVQPLYVNAPPKPRRVTEPSDSSTDHDFCNMNTTTPTTSTTPTCSDLAYHSDRGVYQPPYAKKVLANVAQSQLNGTSERRTPDVYGRSSSIDPRSLTYSRCKAYKQSNADYEELYNLTMMNHNSSDGSQISPNRATFTPASPSRAAFTNRSCSVDFLEAENKRSSDRSDAEFAPVSSRGQNGQRDYRCVPPPRPKSSIDIINADSFYWSEERYAQNMRKSAQFLVGGKKPPPPPQLDVMKRFQEYKLPYHSSPNYRDPPDPGFSSSANGSSSTASRKVIECGGDENSVVGNVSTDRLSGSSHIVTNGGTAHPHQQRQPADKRWNDYSVVDPFKSEGYSNRSDFIRSKSARIPREKELDQLENAFGDFSYKRRNSLHSSESADKSYQQAQQREESMKRLLEWKQRMLQSPLSRKASGSSNRGAVQNDLFRNYKPTASSSNELSAAQSESFGRSRTLERNTNSVLGHASHSWHVDDDDEELVANDGRSCSRLANNPDISGQTNRVYRDNHREGAGSANLFNKYDSQSSDDEEPDKAKGTRSWTRRGSQVSSNDSSSTLIRISPSAAVGKSADAKTTRLSKSPCPMKDDDTSSDNAALLQHSSKHSDSSYDILKMDNREFRSSTLPINGGKSTPANEIRAPETKLRSSQYECPPANLVQNRIRVFEKPPETQVQAGDSVRLKEPLKVSSSHEPNQAVVSSIKSQVRTGEERTAVATPDDSPPTNGSLRSTKSTRDLLWNRDDATEQLTTRKRVASESRASHQDYPNDVYSFCEPLNDLNKSSPRESQHLNADDDAKLAASQSDQVASSPEDHYLPMAPSKKTFSAPPGDLFYHTRSNSASSASQILILETLLSEDVENSYVEMTVASDGRLYHEPRKLREGLAPDKGSVPEKSSPSHYEFLYKASSSREPLYMEVQTKEKWPCKEDAPTEAEAPPVSTEATTSTRRAMLPDILNSSNTLRQLTDSSDADDEASKDLNPLEVPRHPRFSLSDTFRPASYYLGGSYSGGGVVNGCNSAYTMPGTRNTLTLSFDQPDSSDSDLVSPPLIPTSPASLDDFDVSLELAAAPIVAKELPHERTSSREHSLSETESFNSRNKLSRSEKDSSDLESTAESYSSTITTLPETAYDDYISRDKHIEELPHYNGLPSRNKNDPAAVQGTSSSRPPPPAAASPPPDVDDSADGFDSNSNFLAGSVSHLGAPYYYADLLKMNAESATGVPNHVAEISREEVAIADKNRFLDETSTAITLNNKRDNCSAEIVAASKRNDIGKKVNQIAADGHPASSFAKSSSTCQMVVDMKNTVQLLRLTDKNVDDKNIYSSYAFQSKLHKTDYRSKTPEPLSDAINLYTAHSRNNEATMATKNAVGPPNRRSRSLEGLLDSGGGDPSKNNIVWNNNSEQHPHEQTTRGRTPTLSPAPPVSGDIWEEDSLWRENLRRMSLRHARSLDDLDKDDGKTSSAATSGRQSADILGADKARRCSKKLSRDVTYVNDCVTAQILKAKQNAREYTEDYREVRRIKRCVRIPVSSETVDDGVHYERLDPRATLPAAPVPSRSPNYQYYNGNDARESASNGSAPIANMKQHGKYNTQPKTGAQSFLEEGVYPTKPPSFEIDREKLRQWDLMSSAPVAMLNAIQRYPAPEAPSAALPTPTAFQTTDRNTARATLMAEHNTPPASPAYGSGSVIGRDTLPLRNPALSLASPAGSQHCVDMTDVASTGNLGQCQYPSRESELRCQSPPSSDMHTKRSDSTWNLNVSAGELLGRTHEELVLLLIQLRRQSASVCKAMENCHREIESQARLAELKTPKKSEHLNRVEELKKRLTDLEKQYEKGKPLVNLVDNMVKLGSLYRAGAPSSPGQLGGPLREKLEFNHRIQEQRLLAEERKEWDRISPDHHQLQAKVEELYKLDRELQHESSTLQSLKQDKDLLENALGGLKHKIQGTQGNPTEMERYRRQQLLLERELSHVRSVLARNSKKLEETVTANARLEGELVVLRQKLQWNQRSSEDSGIGAPTVATLESELKRVQMLVGDLQRQRSELSAQVRQLTEKSNNLSQQIRPSPTGIAGAGPVPARKRANSGWTETDLDGDITHDASVDHSSSTASPTVQMSALPVYANTEDRRTTDYFGTTDARKKTIPSYDDLASPFCSPDSQCGRPPDINESDDRNKRFYGIIPREKPQEIKTVRIVKRESERRQRDRDRSGNVGIPISASSVKRASMYEDSGSDTDRSTLSMVVEEREKDDGQFFSNVGYLRTDIITALPDYEYRANFDPLSISPSPKATDNVTSPYNSIIRSTKTDIIHRDQNKKNINTSSEQKSTATKVDSATPPQLSPVYQSEAAKQIVQELVSTVIPRRGNNKRLIPKEKRRHHTVSSSKPLMPMTDAYIRSTRARDDVDMERALRPRLNGTPDVVRSTLSRTDPVKYNAETIDSIIGTPGKISIPERYVPETEPELSPEEQKKRLKKADAIRRMLSETTALATIENENEQDEKSVAKKKKIEEDRRQRDHILHLNQILAQQVIEKSKLVAVKALSDLALDVTTAKEEENDRDPSPIPFPLYQQRVNYFT